MAVHHGGKAGKTLASKSSSKPAKSKAGTTLANHKVKKDNDTKERIFVSYGYRKR
ncbi:hypothetical protein ACTQ1L_06390 [Agathobacter sp. LCP21S3_B2]|uniref:hypothetical protein n=1 Tax=Agathobacter sp. LCP21S3_B2 TaxID=3438734 RepID=UPI003F8E0270